MLNRLMLAGGALLLCGCATPPAAIPDWGNHPANPASAAAPLPTPSQTLAVPQPVAATTPATQLEAPQMSGMHHGSGATSPDMGGMTPSSLPSQGGKP